MWLARMRTAHMCAGYRRQRRRRRPENQTAKNQVQSDGAGRCRQQTRDFLAVECVAVKRYLQRVNTTGNGVCQCKLVSRERVYYKCCIMVIENDERKTRDAHLPHVRHTYTQVLPLRSFRAPVSRKACTNTLHMCPEQTTDHMFEHKHHVYVCVHI